jgi:hypothetical protein
MVGLKVLLNGLKNIQSKSRKSWRRIEMDDFNAGAMIAMIVALVMFLIGRFWLTNWIMLTVPEVYCFMMVFVYLFMANYKVVKK